MCRLFQDEGPFRQSMMESGGARYRLRMGEANAQAVHAQQGQLCAEEEQEEEDRRWNRRIDFLSVLMLGNVNGRADFQRTCAFRHATCGGLQWTASEHSPVSPSARRILRV